MDSVGTYDHTIADKRVNIRFTPGTAPTTGQAWRKAWPRPQQYRPLLPFARGRPGSDPRRNPALSVGEQMHLYIKRISFGNTSAIGRVYLCCPSSSFRAMLGESCQRSRKHPPQRRGPSPSCCASSRSSSRSSTSSRRKAASPAPAPSKPESRD